MRAALQNDRSNHDMDREWAPELTVGLSQVEAAYENVRAYVHRTPTLTSATLSRLTGSTVFLKAENLQKTGSFKARERHQRDTCFVTRGKGSRSHRRIRREPRGRRGIRRAHGRCSGDCRDA